MAARTKELQDIIEGFHAFKRGIEATISCREVDFHITNSQWLVLDIIRREGSASIKTISAELGISSSGTTQMVNELMKNGYVLKHSQKEDKRVTVVVLSPKTEKVLQKLHVHVLRNMAKIFSVLTDKEFATFHKLQLRLIETVTKNK
ncbi:MAG: MarR family winged helix-turn-helix transcriptional regulator [Candidatus Paceibacteria bacterium]